MPSITFGTFSALAQCLSIHRILVIFSCPFFYIYKSENTGNVYYHIRWHLFLSLQSWADAFRSTPDLTGVVTVYEDLRRKGLEFPMTDLDMLSPIHTPQRVRLMLPFLDPWLLTEYNGKDERPEVKIFAQ